MNINEHLLKKVQLFPKEYNYLAKLLLQEIEKGKKSESQIQQMLLDEIAEILEEEE